MPYILTFSKQVEIPATKQYINDCCIDGDVVLNQLLPVFRDHYDAKLRSSQEDWGWFVWFKAGSVKLGIDIFTEDPKHFYFKVLLTSHRSRLLRTDTIEDRTELELLRELVVQVLSDWSVTALTVQQVNKKYLPM